jgi:hypothetical protein
MRPILVLVASPALDFLPSIDEVEKYFPVQTFVPQFERRRCQLQIDRDGLTFGRAPQTIRTPVCGLGTVTERNRKCLLQKDRQFVIVDRPAALAGRTADWRETSLRPPLSATEWIVRNTD